MLKIPFDVVKRTLKPDGLDLILQHRECGGKVVVYIGDKEDLTERKSIKCGCGKQTILFFANPELGRKLIEILKLPTAEDRFDQASGEHLN